ncbi:MAG: response regulator [Aggregatilineales bacterium]
MTTSVLLINRQLVFAVTIKQALEQTGAFIVHPFTAADAALEYLRDHPHDVALVDFTLPDYNGPQLVRRLRAIQPGIAVIVSPAQPNARALMQELDLQGIVDAPFSARTIIPVIEHAVELFKQPLWARTRSLVDNPSPDSSATDVLVDSERELADQPPDLSSAPLQAGPLSDAPDKAESGAEPLQTHMLDESFDDDAADFLPPPPVYSAETRVLDDVDDDSLFPWERSVPDKGGQLPFSSLDSILMDEAPSEMFEPAVGDEDTPSVPAVDSEAVRQFLATYHPTDKSDTFGDVLEAIDPAVPAAEGGTYAPGSFDDLVNSMRADRQHTPLPDRHQQFIEFILTGGMDTLLTELEKAKTGEFARLSAKDSEPAPQADSFTALAAEEPPLPTLEESGPIGDLMIGVSDSSFRDVLALMCGEQVVPSQRTDAERFDADFDAFYASSAAEPAQAEDYEPGEIARDSAGQEIDAFFAELEEAKTPPFVSPDPPPREPPSAGIPARLILETAQDESTPADSFSLDTLIDDIERQLEQHLPEIKPLPSWGEGFKLPRRAVSEPPAAEDVAQEPDFLAEVFDEPAALTEPAAAPALPTWDDAPDEAFETTLASQAQRELIEAGRDDQETELLFEQAAGAADEAPALPPETAWPQAELDISSIWESFVPAESYQEHAPYAGEAAEEALPAFDSEALHSGDALASLTAPPTEEHPDWLEELLPTAPPAAETPPPAPTEPERQPIVTSTAAETEPAAPSDAWERAETAQVAAEATPALPTRRPPAFELAAALEDARHPEADDPYIAQLALSLTQVSLELTAEATLLTRDGEIVAVAGTLAPEDIGALREAVSDEWAAGEDDARIRFLALDGGSREFMVYSRRTVGGFILSMIFAGTTPLRDIRRQGKRLSEALAAVPETPPPVSPPLPATPATTVKAPTAPAQAAPLAPYTYMWLLRDPNITLNEAVAQALTAGLRAQLTELGWRVQALRAQDEYVYVYADVPGEQSAFAVAEDLKRRAASILRAQGAALDPRALWADSYLVLTPGREPDADEIAQFIEFERML